MNDVAHSEIARTPQHDQAHVALPDRRAGGSGVDDPNSRVPPSRARERETFTDTKFALPVRLAQAEQRRGARQVGGDELRVETLRGDQRDNSRDRGRSLPAPGTVDNHRERGQRWLNSFVEAQRSCDGRFNERLRIVQHAVSPSPRVNGSLSMRHMSMSWRTAR